MGFGIGLQDWCANDPRASQEGVMGMRKYPIEKTAYYMTNGVFYSEKLNEIIVLQNGKLEAKTYVSIGLQNSIFSDFYLFDFVYIGEL